MQILYNSLSRSSSIKGFTFVNMAGATNYNNNEYSDFKTNMAPIKQLPIVTDMRWYTSVVL